MAALAEGIYLQFLSEEGELQINAPADKVKAVRDYLDQEEKEEKENFRVLMHIFDPLVVEVVQMMKLNSFPKFQASPFFKKMMSALHHDDVDDLRDSHLIELTPTVHPPVSSKRSSRKLSLTTDKPADSKKDETDDSSSTTERSARSVSDVGTSS